MGVRCFACVECCPYCYVPLSYIGEVEKDDAAFLNEVACRSTDHATVHSTAKNGARIELADEMQRQSRVVISGERARTDKRGKGHDSSVVLVLRLGLRIYKSAKHKTKIERHQPPM